MKTKLLLLIFLSLGLNAFAQYTSIPDTKFEEKLISLGIDDVADGRVLTSKINTLKILNLRSSSIKNLTGIQDFIALTDLRCDSNILTTVDFSKNTALTSLNCDNNQLTALDLTKNTALKDLSFSVNKITSIDLSKNTALTSITVYNNPLAALDLSNNTALTYLSCWNNKLTNLDVSKNVALRNIRCDYNPLTKLNLKNGKNTLLTSVNFAYNRDLSCIIVDDVAYAQSKWGNQDDVYALFTPYDCSLITPIPDAAFEDKLIALGIDTDGKNGVVLNSSITSITALNVSNSAIADLTGLEGFTGLVSLDCSNNSLKSINLSNAKSFTTLDCTGNASLTCIQVANIAQSSTNWSVKKDAAANFSLDCNAYTLIPDPKFEDELVQQKFDDVVDGKVLTSKINKIKSIYISSNSVQDLTGIQDFTALTSLECGFNRLSSLDLSKNKELTVLRCDNNSLKSLDLSNNTKLNTLSCRSNQLTILDISKNPNISFLDLAYNQLSSFDVSKNANLSYLNCNGNKLKNLDLSKNIEVYFFDGTGNRLESLDLSKNTKLRSLFFTNNKLTTLNLKNGNNSKLNALDFSENPFLGCVSVDDVTYANANWSEKKQTHNYFTATECSMTTQIPNNAFEDKLIALGIDTDGKNGFVLNSSINTISTLDISNSSLTDVRGLEGFTALKTLNVSNNALATIDLSKNNALTTLNCANNATLTCIMVADIAAAKKWATTKDAKADFSLDCRNYTLIPDENFEAKLISLELDDVKDGKVLTSNINAVKYLTIYSSSIKDLTGIQDFAALVSLTCNDNEITKLDVSQNKNLNYLYCPNNQITSFDSSKNSLLETLYINSNALTKLEVNPEIKEIRCQNNQITSLDLSKTTQLNSIYCSNNKLTSLNLKNGKNNLLSFHNFTNNPDLSCIIVDDPVYSYNRWRSSKDANAFFTNLGCSDVTGIYDSLFEDKLIALGIDTDGKNGTVLNSSIQKITTLDVSNTSITNLSGIQGFTTLTTLECGKNKLKTLDVSKNTALTSLNCNENQLTQLDISNNVSLTNLKTSSNQLTSLDVSKNTALTHLDFSTNKVKAIDLTKNKALIQVICNANQLTSLNVSENKTLTALNCSSNVLESLNLKNGNNKNFTVAAINFTGNPSLSCIRVDDKAYSDTNWLAAKDASAAYNTSCGLSLPPNNFTVQTKGESCLGQNNGEINIKALETLAYTASINGQTKSFTNNTLNVAGLTPGNYTVTITIPGEIFEQSFNLVIPKGITITGKSSISSKKVNVEITDGTAPYTVFVDGVEQFQTDDSSFSLTAKNGSLLEVKTAKACEGSYTEDIYGLDLVVAAYPNPTSGAFEIDLPSSKKEVVIEIIALDGRAVSNQKYSLENGTVQLTLENQPSGIYVAKIHLGSVKNVKIIKK
ncbi:T9SS type A sorting domain-containing protein [Flavobacterium foetidum]|uniref:T9SS type A sorting domain-containing protein n=1 Tax=Flavobacterium foetidum TaxID=2026681 RepID=UPI001075533B|nr:T9SS type A sorting domain-containing protein [Flavobacterium foetidum]KAF2515707.1 T9SS type A sorting domain-containing protein [Flavobacterium foetidum]